MTPLDETDLAILAILQKHAKTNIKEIALRIGLTQTPTYERIKRLEKTGIIENYQAVINHAKLGYTIEVFCQVTLQVHAKELINRFERHVNKMNEVIECYHVAGNYDYLLKVLVEDMKSYQLFLKNKLSVLDSVSNVQSTFILSATKRSSVIS
ncbi:MAG: Lrp/AsnC family transcriptional regulator [Lutibacter sp.]